MTEGKSSRIAAVYSMTENITEGRGTLEARFLEPSPYLADGGEKVGRLPRKTPVKLLRELGHPESPIKAIRANCVDCSGGQVGEVRKCVSVRCPLRPYRMGKNPFYGKAEARRG